MDIAKVEKRAVAVVLLDAEKAFDRVAWGYLRDKLAERGFGLGLIRAIQAVYYKPHGKIQIMGYTSRRWKIEREKQTPQTKPLDLYKLRVEIEELMAGNVGLDRLNTYSEEELSFICKSFTRNTRVLHEKLTETAVSMGVDISKSKPLQKPYRADFSDKDIEHLNVAGKKLQIKELMGVLQKWGDVEKWRSRWAKKREEVRSRQVTPEFALREVEKPEQLCPMREVPGGKYVHVPWSRQDIVSFTNDFPKLREKPVDWYRQVERFVKVQKCLWKDLDGFFDIVVPVDLWTQCKINIDWPSEEYPRNKETGEPSKEVMRKYEQVIQHLKEKVPAKETDWTKIDRTTQERDETVHSFYERLLQVFKTYSGIDNIDLKNMTHFIYRFVNGLRPEICQWIKDNKICWHTKKMDEVLRYAKYCEDEMAEKKKALKEKVMWAQVKLAEQQEKQLKQGYNYFVTPREKPTFIGGYIKRMTERAITVGLKRNILEHLLLAI
ncbi:uncharacterized protein LOC144792027 [Lissotriton helveticus]